MYNNNKLIGISLHKNTDYKYTGIDIHLYNVVICLYFTPSPKRLLKYKFRCIKYNMNDIDTKESYFNYNDTLKFIGVIL